MWPILPTSAWKVKCWLQHYIHDSIAALLPSSYNCAVTNTVLWILVSCHPVILAFSSHRHCPWMKWVNWLQDNILHRTMFIRTSRHRTLSLKTSRHNRFFKISWSPYISPSIEICHASFFFVTELLNIEGVGWRGADVEERDFINRKRQSDF